MLCPTCKRVPAACKCHKGQSPWRKSGGQPNSYTTSAVLVCQQMTEAAEAQRQRRTILTTDKERNKAASRRERDMLNRRYG